MSITLNAILSFNYRFDFIFTHFRVTWQITHLLEFRNFKKCENGPNRNRSSNLAWHLLCLSWMFFTWLYLAAFHYSGSQRTASEIDEYFILDHSYLSYWIFSTLHTVEFYRLFIWFLYFY